MNILFKCDGFVLSISSVTRPTLLASICNLVTRTHSFPPKKGSLPHKNCSTSGLQHLSNQNWKVLIQCTNCISCMEILESSCIFSSRMMHMLSFISRCKVTHLKPLLKWLQMRFSGTRHLLCVLILFLLGCSTAIWEPQNTL